MLSIVNPKTREVTPGSPFARKTARAIQDCQRLVESTHDCGFMDGGCLILAKGMEIWSKGDIQLGASVRAGTDIVDHWFGCITTAGDYITLDADGLQTQDDLQQKMRLIEMSQPQILIKGALPVATEALQDQSISDEIATHLQRRLGQYTAWRMELTTQAEGAVLLSDQRQGCIQRQSDSCTVVVSSIDDPDAPTEIYHYQSGADAAQDLLMLWQVGIEPSGYAWHEDQELGLCL